MKRIDLARSVEHILRSSGFYVSDSNMVSGISFDLIARRDDILLVIKIFSNIDSLDKKTAEELKVIAKLLDASPLVVGEKSTSKPLESGVMYRRYDIPIISVGTLYDFFIEGVGPLIEAGKGGYYVTIDGEKLKRARLVKRISLRIIADLAGVSKRSILAYEKGGMRTTVDIAINLEELTGEELIKEQDILKKRYAQAEEGPISLEGLSPLEKEIIAFLLDIGCKVIPLRHSQLNALTKEESHTILTGMSEEGHKLKEKAKIISTIAKITEKPSVFFLEKEINRKSMEGIPIIHKKELKRISDPSQIIEIIIERSE